ncbi:NahK/ErcS family hybrid sensor histidine kinase/response regulator [Dokdonella sp.]|uniref:hybrid sensor histidine kinase/response regulator n=1 Tax=Dokdonella sp. TaxID=2291710 RepID=UPI0025C2E3AB|nr:NahK/ErcS family hybrid sensor histidine kinase/response regulator [Dokdonella sp.]MBX3688719.1 PAS domain-containing hybrid sensor histidine kinase/response regulator [Dokdonella sp.]
MSSSEVLVATAGLIWLVVLFAVARYGERHPGLFARRWDIVYALSLGVHCTSWTFYGTVTQAERSGWWLPPTFIGLILLYALGIGVLLRLVRLAREQHASSLADFVAARLGRHAGLAALVTAVTVLGIVPYIALQLKAVAMSFALFGSGNGLDAPPWQDSALYVALAMALFAMLFGTRRAAAAAHNRGLVLALAFESLFKLGAMLALGALVLSLPDVDAAVRTAPRDASGFPALIVLGALAAFTLPHQFHAGVVECRDAAHVRTARWLFPLYLCLIALPVLPLAQAGAARLGPLGVSSDLYVLALPLAQGQRGLAVLAFLGGLSAATSMVILATLALSLMIGNHWIAPLRLRGDWLRGEGGDLRPAVLRQRRIAILAVVLLAWLYSRAVVGSDALADIGALSFSALAGLMPAVLIALYWPRIGARAVCAGLIAGTLVWLYTIAPSFLPALRGSAWLPAALSAPELFGLGRWSGLARALTASLAINVMVTLALARTRWARHGASASPGELAGSELAALALRFLPSERVAALVDATQVSADARHVAAVEHELATVIGAASARLLIEVARRERVGRLDAVADIVDQTSRDLRFNQRVLEAALENMTQGICVVDAKLDVVAWNRRYEQLFAYPPGLLSIGRPVAELMRHNIILGLIGEGEVEARIERRLAQMRAGTAHLSERRFPDGTIVEIRGNPMPNGGFVATFTDVTAFRDAERALTRANETLEQRVAERTGELARASAAAERANLEKTRFLAAVSHDLAQPLHAAQLFTHALAQRVVAQPERETVGHIGSALHAAEDLLAGLLDISRLDAGGMQAQSRAFAAAELLDALAAEFAVLAAAKGLRLRCVRSSVWLHSDPQLLRRVLQNFLSNAVKYTRNGRILLGCRREGGLLRIEVWDTGAGIAPADRDAVFEEFRRLDRDGAGLGLGLSIARRIAQLLGHRLSLRSWPGRGSVFAIDVARAHAPAPAMPTATAVEANMPRRRVLVVDNDAHAATAMRALLEGWNCEVLVAHDPASAQVACRRAQPDLLVLDYHLDDGVTGLDLRAQLATPIAHVPCIVVSADHGDDVRRAVAQAGVHLLHKPLRPLALKSLMARVLIAS